MKKKLQNKVSRSTELGGQSEISHPAFSRLCSEVMHTQNQIPSRGCYAAVSGLIWFRRNGAALAISVRGLTQK